jgi:hypothetical protein
VDVFRGTLASVTDVELFRGANTIAILASSGRWEIVQFGTAVLVAPGRYRLARLLRGQLGTEDGMGAPAGAPFVVLDAAVVPLAIAEAEVGVPLNWRIGPASRPLADGSYVQQAFTPAGRGLLSFAPAQPRLQRTAAGDLRIRWLRRIRLPAADNWALASDPLPEATEAYDLEIMDDTAVKRAVSGLSAPEFLYTAAMQAADWGGPVSQVSIRVWQLGPLGRGLPLVATIAITEAE